MQRLYALYVILMSDIKVVAYAKDLTAVVSTLQVVSKLAFLLYVL